MAAVEGVARWRHVGEHDLASASGHGSNILIMQTSLSSPSRSTALAAALGLLLVDGGAMITAVDCGSLPLTAAGTPEAECPAPVARLLQLVERADAIVIAGPVHNGQVAGLTRHWAEVTRRQIQGKPVLPVVSAATQRAAVSSALGFAGDLAAHFRADALAPVSLADDEADAVVLGRLREAELALFASLQPKSMRW